MKGSRDVACRASPLLDMVVSVDVEREKDEGAVPFQGEVVLGQPVGCQGEEKKGASWAGRLGLGRLGLARVLFISFSLF